MNILAIDQGTSATKALLTGPDGEVLGAAEVPVHPRSLPDGGVEQDPAELLESVLAAGQAAVAAARAPAHALALANQGETVLAWDRRTGRPLTPAIVWQDRRSAGICTRLAGHAGQLTAITGLPLDPYFAAPKMTWLRENLTRDGVVTTTDSWLLARLGAGYLTDATTASRTLLLDLDEVAWSPAACAAFGMDPGQLPDVADCAGVSGETSAFGHPVPVAGLAVDQQAALLAEGCFAAGEAKCTYGTGAFLLVTTGSEAVRSGHGLSASVAWRLPGTTAYCLDGQVYTAGAAVRWLTGLGLLDGPAEPGRGGRQRARCRRRHVPARAGRAGRAALAAGRPRRVPRAGPRHHPRAPGPGGGRGHRRVGRAAGPVRGRGPRRAAAGAPRGRRADPVPAARPGPGRPAPGAGTGLRGSRRDRAGRRGPGPAGHRRGQHAG